MINVKTKTKFIELEIPKGYVISEEPKVIKTGDEHNLYIQIKLSKSIYQSNSKIS
jgi:hypothetical protein